jgi:hypothetical protein
MLLLCFCTLSTFLFLFKIHNVLKIVICLRLQVEPNQLDPINRASPYLGTPPHPTLALGMYFCCRIAFVLEESKDCICNLSGNESMALKSLEISKKIRILQTDKGNCTNVLIESTRREKTSSQIEPRVNKILHEDSMSEIVRTIRIRLTNYIVLKYKLTS